MRYIVVQWMPEVFNKLDGKAMRVICSNHPRFQDGTRFDFGFLGIASDQGYTITVLPSAETLDIVKWRDMGEEDKPVGKPK